MIITCERCATRFKVPDDKLAAGAVRMRCSKCNHVFLAGPAAVVAETGAAPPAPGSLPPSFATTMPPLSSSPSAVPAPVSGAVPVFGAPRAPSHDPFSTLGPPPARPDPFASASPSMPPTPSRPDPFGGLGAAPPRPLGDPFAGLQPSTPPRQATHDPFAGLGAPGTPAPFTPPPPPATSRKVTADPFAGIGLSATTSTPKAPTNDPFAGIGRTTSPPPAAQPLPVDPFAGLSSSVPPTPRADPFASRPPSQARPDPFGSAGIPRSDPFGPASAGPVDPFGAASVPSSDPFAAALSQPPRPSDPFALVTSPPKAAPVDPFAEPAVADPFRAARAPTPMPPPPDDEDHFGRLDDVGASYDDAARSSLFGIPAPTPPTTPHGWGGGSAPPSPGSIPSGLELAVPTATSTPPTPSSSSPGRFIPLLRAALNVLQLVLFVAFVVVAVVVGRGGSPLALIEGDLRGAWRPGQADDVALRVDHLDVAWRTGRDGVGLLVVTGTIHNGGDAAVPAVVVEVSADGTPVGRGFAWSDVDAFAVASVTTPDDIAALQTRRPKAPRVAPGDDAPFVIVAPAPGPSADIAVVARPGQ